MNPDPLTTLVRLADHPTTPETQRQWNLAYCDMLIAQYRTEIRIARAKIREQRQRKAALMNGSDKAQNYPSRSS